ncbi:NADH-quinone oxidoreductase subunit C [Variovorax paradoxus]|uniref:Hydrogenase-4 component G n=1 Tax=Variovorax paradoxus TaxID=34073 RepID=A0A0H2M7U7_VARPD|nr:NADH-quinone oxidoreductase subunit C [Variovorax paradoxus]KLN53100.1 hydrogenase-4 component G [Variovorax paradoxus]
MMQTREIVTDDLATWVDRCAQALDAGDRLITLFGRPDAGGDTVVTAVVMGGEGGLRILRGRGRRLESFPSLTPRHPAAQMFERELWEQTGLIPAGHPWLKPVRYEGEHQQHMTDYPFFKVRGQEIHEVGVGPIHASVIEPGHFRFMCHGEQVHHLEIQLGYQHRGVEALLLRRPPLALASLVESIAGDSSIAYAWGYCAAVEALSGTRIRIETDLVRGVALELERVAMHLASLTGLATDIAFLQGGATYGRLRTAIINACMRICGSRFGRGWLRPGGVRYGISEEQRQDLLATIAAFAKDFAEVNDLMLDARSVRSRFRGVGVVGSEAARDLGLVGLAGRASGMAVDMRVSLPGRLYTRDPITLLTEESGDCWARLKLRMREIDESVRWLTRVLETPELDLASVAPALPGPLSPDTLCVSVREGFRGPVVQSLETGPDGRLIHYKVQDPSLLNWFGLAFALRGNEISDFPICNKSFDLSYCGNDL